MADANTFDPGVLERLDKLRDKYAAMGQDLNSYLDGLLHADFPTYWDYIHPRYAAEPADAGHPVSR